MVIHDLRNPTLSLKNGLDISISKIEHFKQYKRISDEMSTQYE